MRRLPPEVVAWLEERAAGDRPSLEDAWTLSGRAVPAMDPSDHHRKANVWAAVTRMIDESEREEMPHPRLRLVSGRAWLATAVAAAIVILVGAAFLLRPVTIHAPNGEFAAVVLSGGTAVTLNSGTSLTYRPYFVTGRRVQLDGEAFFEVAAHRRPFVVETFNARTTVLGTEFNVRARRDEWSPSTSVVVVSGRVRLESKEGDASAVVDPGRRSVVSATHEVLEPDVVVLERELAWRRGGLAFSDQPFGVIFAEIERRFDVRIQTSAPIAEKPYSVFLQEPRSARSVIADLAQAEGLRYRETANGFEIYRP